MPSRENFSINSVERVDLLLLASRPAEQSEKIPKSRRQESGVAIRRHGNHFAVLALRQLAFIRRHDQRQMSKRRRRDAESFVYQDLLVGICQVILARE